MTEGRPGSEPLVAVALAVTVAGLVTWFAAVALDAPGAAVGAGVALVGLGAVVAGVSAFAAARRGGVGVGGALWRGAKTLVGWLFAVLP